MGYIYLPQRFVALNKVNIEVLNASERYEFLGEVSVVLFRPHVNVDTSVPFSIAIWGRRIPPYFNYIPQHSNLSQMQAPLSRHFSK